MAASPKNSLSTGMLFTDRRDFYIQPNVVNELYQDVTPFTTLVGKLGSTSISDPVFKMFEYRNAWLDQYIIHNNAGAADITTAGDITITATFATPGLGRNTDGATRWNDRELAVSAFNDSVVGLLLQVKSGDNIATFRVTSFSGATLTCAKVGAVGNNFTVADGSKFHVIGSAFEEGGSAPEAASDDISVIWGRTQIAKTAIEVTGTLYHMALRGYSDELARLRQEKMKEFKIQQERTFLLGIDPKRAAYDTALGSAQDTGIRYSEGVIPSILRFGKTYESTDNANNKKANIFSLDSSTSYANWVDMMENLFSYIPSSSENRMLLCGSGVLSFFSKPDAQTLFKVGSANNPFILGEPLKSEFGFDVRKLSTPHGSISLVHAPVLRGDWRNYGVIVDTDYVKKYTFRPMVYQTNIKTDNAYDGVKDQIMSDEGIGLSMIEKHAVVKVA